MAYYLKKITLRTDNSKKGKESISALWNDIETGKLPLLFDTDGKFLKGISPVAIYSNYESDETGAYDLSVMGVMADFFDSLEKNTAAGQYFKIETTGETVEDCTVRAWQQVWQLSGEGKLKRAFTCDIESCVPKEYTKDGKAHCYLYIALHHEENCDTVK